MLSKDITLKAAIFDLLDNSLDGARRMRGEDLDGLWVKIVVKPSGFAIEDNCGGIPISIAERYAFRFGRTDEAKELLDFEHSTGQFGIGMKRAFFKLGTRFTVDSKSVEGRFKMDEDVSDWFASRDEGLDSWGFGMDVVAEDEVPVGKRGTKIAVRPLHETVAEDFSFADFTRKLRVEIGERYVVPLEEGLKVFSNGASVHAHAPDIIVSKRLDPTVRAVYMDREGNDVQDGDEAAVTLRLLCGVAGTEAPKAGWSVALNSRMVLLADKTETVGWNTQNGTRIPAFHNQYGRLRGLALLDAAETTALPWNTTKSQLDVNQAIYRRARREMVLAMEPVVKFLNRVKTEGDEARRLELDAESRPLHRLFEGAKEKSAIRRLIDGVPHEFSVEAKRANRSRKPTTSIQYDVDRRRAEQAKKALGVPSNARVGEETFEFWWRSQFD